MHLLILFLPLAAAFDLSVDLDEEENLPEPEEVPENINNENVPRTEEIPENNSHENVLTIDTIPNTENVATVEEVPVDDNENVATVEEVPVDDNENVATVQEVPVDNNENVATVQEVPVDNNENVATVQEVPVDNNENVATVEEVPVDDNENVATVEEVPVPVDNNENVPTIEEVPENNEDSATKDVVPENVKNEIVDSHNEFRRNVEPTASNMLKMTWNNDIAVTAKAWAEKCTGKRSDKDDRIMNGVPCAEIMSKSTGATTWKEIIEMWYSKKSNFQYGIGAVDPKKDVGVYTQLVWYKSHEIGCAAAYCPGNEYPFMYACRYCPAGNIVGQLLTPYKKGEPCGDCPNDCEDKLCTNPCKYHDKAYGCKEMKKMFDCSGPPLSDHCQATCNCQTEIA